MAEGSFGVLYDGPALESGEIPVRDLAPALLALGELFTETSVMLYPSRPPVSLNVKATGDGSFWVYLHLMAEEWKDLIDIFGSNTESALVNMTGTVYTLFGLIKWARGRVVGRDEAQTAAPPDPGMVRIVAPDGTRMEVPSDVWLLFQRQSARRKAKEVVAPLERPGIDRLEFRPTRMGEPDVVVLKDELDSFTVVEEEQEPLTDTQRRTLVEIVSLGYEDNKRWRFREGAATFNAPIEDDAFWERVHRREIPFLEGDMLRVTLRVIQTLRPDGRLHADFFVLKVWDVVTPDDLRRPE